MDIFSAISDPTRRAIIERLNRHGPQSIKELGKGLDISRQGLTKHLDKLVKSKIVSAEFVGKERIHSLQPKPMEKLANWLQPFAEQWDTRLGNLAFHLEEKND